MRTNTLFLLDIILYFIFPLLFWDIGRKLLEDYVPYFFNRSRNCLHSLQI